MNLVLYLVIVEALNVIRIRLLSLLGHPFLIDGEIAVLRVKDKMRRLGNLHPPGQVLVE